MTTNPETLITATISCTYGWNPGRGVLATLRATGADVGFSRQEVAGTVAEFEAAIAAARAEWATSKGSHRTALTRLIQRFEGALRCAA